MFTSAIVNLLKLNKLTKGWSKILQALNDTTIGDYNCRSVLVNCTDSPTAGRSKGKKPFSFHW